MKLAVMQPYFFPYIGYFQLISAVDKFLVYDDVNYINRGWINRNNILMQNNPYLFTLPLEKASQNKKINDIYIFNGVKSKQKLFKTIKTAYIKAPYYDKIIPIIEKIILHKENNISKYILFSFNVLTEYLEIFTKFILSSEIKKNNNLAGEDKILNICNIFKADMYINTIGGTSLYDKNKFKANGITLKFLRTDDNLSYKQFDNKFISNLSIIDVLMFNNKNDVKILLKRYTLI